MSLLLCGSIVLSVIGGAGSTAHAETAAPEINWGSCPPPPEGIPDGGQECATLSLPLNYAKPNGQKINVQISRIKSTNSGHRRGVLLSNPGGPGGPGLDMPRLLSLILPQNVLDTYDLVGFDPRGVGTSTPVSCGLSPNDAFQALVPIEQPGGFNATAAFMHQVADSCGHAAGSLLPYITTKNTARDMDQIRQALGEPKISYYGTSYGTELGATYASMFANKTDRFVLDSNVDPTGVWREQFRSWGPGGELRFPDFLDFAAANNSTYHLGSTPQAVRQRYFQLVDRLTAHPLPTVPSGSGVFEGTLPEGTVLNGPVFRELTFSGLYGDLYFPDMAALWHAIDQAPNPAIATTAHPKASLESVDNSEASALAVLCGDTNWSRSVTQYKTEFTLDGAIYPAFGPIGSNIWPCAFWPNKAVESRPNITSNGPSNILLLQDLRDPATPYLGGLKMRAALGGRARLVTIDQGGHSVYLLNPNSCAQGIANTYLADGTFPLADSFCQPDSAGAQAAPFSVQQATPAYKRAVQEILHHTKW